MDVDALLPAGCQSAIQEADKLQKANVKLGLVMDKMNKSIQKQDIESVFQQIIALSLKNDANFYLIYQSHD